MLLNDNLTFALHNIASFFTPNPSMPLVFSSGTFWMMFLVFLPIFACIRHRKRQMMLFVVAFSLFFAFKSCGWIFLLMVATSVIDWHLARRIARAESSGRRKAMLWLSLLCSLGTLVAFKYTNFFLHSWHDIVGGNFQPLDIIAPIGISFYTFRTISYVVDVYKAKMPPVESYLNYLFYLSFFPCLVAGPVVRAKDFMPQLERTSPVTKAEIYGGLWLVMAGVVKKAIVADYLAQYSGIIFGSPETLQGYSGFELLMAALGFTVQLYADFSGYSDMAIGLGAIMGFDLGVNFDHPFRSLNITEFWRRWHISLSFWLRDYVYIPLGGNRKGKVRQYLNLFLTMLIGGFWHGAGLNYIVWGAIHGIALVVHKLCLPSLKKIPDTWPVRLLSGLITFTTVMLAFVFFRAESFAEATAILTGIFTNFDLAYLPPFVSVRYVWCIMLVLLLVAHFVPVRIYQGAKRWFVESHWLFKLAVFVIVVQLVLQFASADVAPFIYAQY
ncbi:MAG: MBOAT family O-acyltransferase [Bacteroidales bacterium]|nr:MBOAT family O-acyltransferase [Bacteroidales bacterium]